jgi:AAA+ ATPase superfamily predicted ATPase
VDIIGRKREKAELERLYTSGVPEFIAVYGRRRVGKTYLIREYFGENISFLLTGTNKASNRQQLKNFDVAVARYGNGGSYRPAKNWFEAFEILRELLEARRIETRISPKYDEGTGRHEGTGRLVVFIDEMPWLDKHKSGFVSALEHFWNDWGSRVPELLLIVCGSATSWVVKKLFEDKGGLHNRLSTRIRLEPFSLKECEEYLTWRGISLNRLQILDAYMVLGGIPYYLSLFKSQFALTQNIDWLFFNKDAPLRNEYTELLASLFKDPGRHRAIIEALAGCRGGLRREEIIEKTGLPNGGSLSVTLAELEQCGFIEGFSDFTKAERGVCFRLVDPFILYFLKFVQRNRTKDEYFWTNYTADGGYHVWVGLAFEQLCERHIPQIKQALGISGVSTRVTAWRSGKGQSAGAQIDLLIDRRDGIINVCEIKYTKTPFAIDKSISEELQRKIQVFAAETRTRKALHLTLLTPYGLSEGSYRGAVQAQVTMDDLFA